MLVDLMVFITGGAPVFFLDPLGGESRKKVPVDVGKTRL
jgi:hypothetical protein